MNIHWILVVLGMAPLAAPGPARGTASQRPLQPAESPAARPDSELALQAWREALSVPDLELREQRFGELVEQVLADHRVERIVRGWAHEEGEPQLAWTSRLVLREVGREREVLRRFLERSGGRRQDPFVALEERINGVPAPGAGVPRAATPGGPSGLESGERSFRLEIGPGGARLEVRSSGASGASGDGAEGQAQEDQVAVYEAPNIGRLLEEHPELARELGDVRFFSQQGPVRPDQLFRALRGRVHSLEDFWAEETGSLRTDVLGVQMRELEVQGLLVDDPASGAGLLVERILPGTIAQVVGLRRGDLLLELNGVVLRSGEDVSRVLRERRSQAPLVVRLDREGEPLKLTWKPSPADEAE